MYMGKLYDKHAIWIRLGFDPSTPEFEPQPNRMSHLGQQNVNSFFNCKEESQNVSSEPRVYFV